MAIIPINQKTTTDNTIDPAQQKANDTLAKNNSMGKDQFLNLLLTQLQNQDPLKPMDNTEFISEMAQFTSLEQMQQLNGSFSQLKANSMIGSYVEGTYTDPTTGDKKEISGTVDSTKYNNGKLTLTVNGQDVDPENVTTTSSAQPYQMQQMTSGLEELKAVSMLGAYIKGTYSADDKGTKKDIAGMVDSVKYNNGKITLTVGNQDVLPDDITYVSAKDAINQMPNSQSQQQTQPQTQQ